MSNLNKVHIPKVGNSTERKRKLQLYEELLVINLQK